MEKVRVFCPGKVNLSLDILGRDADGFHSLRSVVRSVSLGDYVTASARTDNRVNISFIYPSFEAGSYAVGENNTVKKTAEYLAARFGAFGADIIIEKHLPLSGGLGGSSADCAAALLALDALFSFSNRGFNIVQAAAALGSDVNFMLRGGAAIILGKGDIIEPSDGAPLNLVIACATLNSPACSSAAVYKEFDRLNPSFALSPGMFNNALTDAAESLGGQIYKIRAALTAAGAANACMTGSGNCVAGYFFTLEAAQAAAKSLSAQGFYAVPCRTVDKGAMFVE